MEKIMKTSDQMVEIATALSKLQGMLSSVKKDAKGYNYTYANLPSVWEIIRAPLAENGLSIVQDAYTTAEGASVVTRLFHASGQWIEFGPLNVPMGKKDAHATGSSITYSKK